MELGLDQLLKDIKEHASDREAWDMADQGKNFYVQLVSITWDFRRRFKVDVFEIFI